MQFTDFFIKRPVFSTSLSLLLVVIGFISYNSIELRQYPKMDASVVSISTTYTGADAETIESFVTTQIENSIAGVDDIDYITSSSSEGSSRVTINFNLNADIDSDIEDVNSDVSGITSQLPSGINSPIVTKVDPDDMPALVVGFSSNRETPEEVTDYLNRVVIPQITTISGVGSATVLGDHTYAMRLWLDPKKMAALNVTAQDIEDALENNNVQAQAGQIDRKHQIITLTAKTNINTTEQFNNLIIKHDGQKFIKMRDIGKAELGAEDNSTALYIGGRAGVGISVILKSSANPLTATSKVKSVLEQIKSQMPSDITMLVARDSSTYIKSSINEVVHTLLEASAIVLLVIFCFIGSFRSVLIPFVTIPLSLIGAFGIMFALGYSVNTLTLLGFVLAIGMVVDDAIVVLENIHRHIELGLSPFNAAITGAREISFAVIAMTFTLAAVYAPIGFISGYTSILFKEFAFTLAGTIVISGIIALTLSPMMCSLFMKSQHDGVGRIENFVNQRLNAVTSRYQRIITDVLNNRAIVIVVLLGVISLGLIFFVPMQNQSTLAPDEDQGVAIGMAQAPTAANLAYTQKYTSMLAPIYESIPQVTGYAVINGIPQGENSAMTMARLADWSERDMSAQQLEGILSQRTTSIPGIQLMYFSPPSLPGSKSMYPIQFVIQTTGSYAELNTATQAMVQQLEKNPGFQRIQTDLKLDKPQLEISIDRDKANSLGIDMEQINDILNLSLAQPETNSFTMNGDSYYIIPQILPQYRNNTNAVSHFELVTDSGGLTSLDNIVTLKNIVSPNSLNHFQQQRAATINAVLNAGYSEQEAINYFISTAKSLLSSDMTYDFAGATRQFMTAGSSMAQIFLFSLLFIYLVLSAQFESFRDPLIVMFSVPLSLVGALVTLDFSGGSLNIYTEIGLITLVGLISKHGILIVEFANQLQLQGKTVTEAVISAATIRLRPILMTTAAMVLSALPLALASGAGAASRQQMGWTIMGGMLFGTILTLFVIPTMYTFMAKNRECGRNVQVILRG